MKRFLAAGFAFAAMAVTGWSGEAPFTQTIGPDDLAATGLDRLSPAQISRLNALITDYKNGALESVRKSADEALAAKRAAEAEARAAKAEAVAAKKAAETETKAAKAEVLEIKKTSLGFFSKAKIMLMPGTTVEYAIIKSTIAGAFNGWEGRAVFHLANGQYWQVANSGNDYYTRAKENIEVEITQSSLGGYWMRFPTLDTQVRVKLLTAK